MTISIVYIILGFVMLMSGADFAVKGAVEVANRFKIPTFIIGLTIVALGTSIPEFIVSLKAALADNPGIAIGNIIGSNIANILLVLGVSAMINPITCAGKVFYRDFSFLFIVTLVFAFFIANGELIHWNGWILLGFLAVFLFYNYDGAKNDPLEQAEQEVDEYKNKSWWFILFVLFGGLLFISFGSDVLINGATNLAKICGLSDEVIALTIIAIGTSTPELATSAVSAFKKQNGIALGNVIGSNIWNIVFVIGTTSSITHIKVADQFILLDMWIMVFASFMLLPVMIFKNKITRKEGSFMFLCFIGYIIIQVLVAQGIWILHK